MFNKSIQVRVTISIERLKKQRLLLRKTIVAKNNHKLLKSKRWMPWLSEAKKDVISCDKLRGVAHKL